jgi:hypothetical protein
MRNYIHCLYAQAWWNTPPILLDQTFAISKEDILQTFANWDDGFTGVYANYFHTEPIDCWITLNRFIVLEMIQNARANIDVSTQHGLGQYLFFDSTPRDIWSEKFAGWPENIPL